MASITTEPASDVFTLLGELRARIRRYVLLEGTASVLAVLGAAFWLSLAFDYWFELPRGLRGVLLIGVTALFVCTLAVWVLLRFFRDLHNRALALVLERRF